MPLVSLAGHGEIVIRFSIFCLLTALLLAVPVVACEFCDVMATFGNQRLGAPGIIS